MEFIEEFICRVLPIISTTVSKEIESGNLIRDLISFGSFLVVLTGCWNAFKQWKYNLQLKRTEYLGKLLEKFRADKELVEVIYRIDKGNEWYNAEFFAGKQFEQQVDRLLSYLSYLCYLKENKIIEPKEFDFIRYNIDRTLRDESMQQYLCDLYHFSQKKGSIFPFPLLLKYAKENGFIKNNFYDENSVNFQIL